MFWPSITLIEASFAGLTEGSERFYSNDPVRKDNQSHYGRWACAEFTDVWQMQEDFGKKVQAEFDRMIAASTR